MERLKVQLGDWTLKNPIIPASGTFGFGLDYLDFYDVNILGSMSLKGTTLEPRFGNAAPRIAETPMGMINSVGLRNPGIHHVIEYELPKLFEKYQDKVIFNLSGFSISEYVECSKLLNNIEQIGILEVNISCPNVKDGGLSFGMSCESAAQVTKAVKEVSNKPVYIKLSPNVSNIVEIAKSCEEAGADGLCLVNTFLSTRIDLRTQKPVLANKVGGLSGPAIFPIALRMVYEVSQAVSIPVIGIGGISSAHDVIEMMMAGASAVQIGAANLVNPLVCKEIIQELPLVMNEYHIDKLSDIIGRAHQ